MLNRSKWFVLRSERNFCEFSSNRKLNSDFSVLTTIAFLSFKKFVKFKITDMSEHNNQNDQPSVQVESNLNEESKAKEVN